MNTFNQETFMRSVAITVATTALAASAALAQQQGVTKDEIVLGSIQDLSGPIAAFGKQSRLGMMLRVDEVNEQGGVNGRKLKLLVEDSAYDEFVDLVSAPARTRVPAHRGRARGSRRRGAP